MKRLLLAAILVSSLFQAEAQVRMPQPSPTQYLRQDFGLGNIEITYSRPAAKGRKIFGDLVPFGKVWRTGANNATVVHFSDPVDIKGKHIDSGSYALYTIPGEDNWEIILNKGVKNWGSMGYQESADVIRVTVPSMKSKMETENFTIQVGNIKPESCEIHICWEKTMVAIPVTTVIKERLRSQLNAAMAAEKKPYFLAAQFYNEYDNNKAKALENAKLAVQQEPNAYWIWIYKARLEQDMGDNAAALASSQRSLALATEQKNDDYVKMNVELQKKLK